MGIPPMDDRWLIEALDLVQRYGSASRAAPFATKLSPRGEPIGIGISREGLQHRTEAARIRNLKPTEKPRIRITAAMQLAARQAEAEPDAVESRPELAPTVDRAALERLRLADEVARLRADLKAANREIITAESVRAEIFGLSERLPHIPDWLVAESIGGSAPGVPMTIWSDWHYQEVVTAAETAGQNEFNAEIAGARVRLLVERTIDLCFSHMVRPEYPGVVICLGGDMITGEIHPELAGSNDRETTEAIIDLQGLLIWAFDRMLERFDRVFVPCVVGNHGRLDLKPRAKGRVVRSYEWLLYTLLEKHYRGNDRIRFFIPGETDAHFRVHGHRYMLTHGDALGVKGGDGIIGSLGPITRGKIKTRNSEAQIGRDFDTMLIGHWHSYLPLPGCIVNGALKGYDEFARLFLRAQFQPPIQALWFNHPRRGVTFQVPVYLDDREAAPAREWVAWAA